MGWLLLALNIGFIALNAAILIVGGAPVINVIAACSCSAGAGYLGSTMVAVRTLKS